MGMAKYDRLLFILNLLRSRRNLNAARLASECGVTERSIYRDIIALSEANVPIYYDNGYKLASDNFLPALNFDFDEYTCLRLTLESTPLRRTGKYASVLKRISAKVEASLSQQVKEQRRTAVDTTDIQIDTMTEERRAAKYYSVIEQAVTDRQCLRLVYDSIESGTATRVVEPYFIVFRARAFYFVAYCRLRKELRTFRLDRIQSVELLPETFVPQKDVTARTYFEGSWEVFSGEPVEVVVRFTGSAAKRVATDRHHAREAVERMPDGSVLYRVTVRGLAEIQRWILGFGDQATVLSPDDLKENLARIGQHFALTYSDISK
jgi:predicted DNA-binding transcriptional regulator YafY